MSNFYVSSPGLNKSKKDSNPTNPNPIEPEDKKLEGYNFGNENYNPHYEQGGEGNQQYGYNQSFPQGVSTFPQGGSTFPQDQYQGSYVQQSGSVMMNPGVQPLNPLPPKVPKTLDENIKTLIDVFKGFHFSSEPYFFRFRSRTPGAFTR